MPVIKVKSVFVGLSSVPVVVWIVVIGTVNDFSNVIKILSLSSLRVISTSLTTNPITS